MKAKAGDYIVTGVEGEEYPVDKNIFEKTYEPVPDFEELHQLFWRVSEMDSVGLELIVKAHLKFGWSVRDAINQFYDMGFVLDERQKAKIGLE